MKITHDYTGRHLQSVGALFAVVLLASCARVLAGDTRTAVPAGSGTAIHVSPAAIGGGGSALLAGAQTQTVSVASNSTGSVTLHPPRAPTANNGTLSICQNSAGQKGKLTASDPDGDPLSYSIMATGAKGTATISNPATGAYAYTPNRDQTGVDTFTFKANDGKEDSFTATVTVTIHALPSTASMTLWLKADAGITKDANGYVSAWADQSGQGHSITQSTAGYRPVYTAGVLNGMPVVRFDGTDDVMASSAVTLSQTHTIIAVTRIQRFPCVGANATPFSYATNIVGGAADVELLVYSDYNGSGSYRFRPRYPGLDPLSDPQMNMPLTSPILLSQVKGISTVKCYANGTKIGPDLTVTTAFSTANRVFRLGMHTSSYQVLNGDIAEIMVYDTALSDTDRQKTEMYLTTKYGVGGRR